MITSVIDLSPANEGCFNSSQSSTIILDDGSSKVEERKSGQSKCVRFADFVDVIHPKTKEESTYDTWYSAEEVERFMRNTMKRAIKIGDRNVELVKRGWQLYDLSVKGETDLAACRKGLLTLYETIEDLVGLENLLFDYENECRQRKQDILKAVTQIRASPVSGDEHRLRAEVSKRISSCSNRWAQVMAETRMDMSVPTDKKF